MLAFLRERSGLGLTTLPSRGRSGRASVESRGSKQVSGSRRIDEEGGCLARRRGHWAPFALVAPVIAKSGNKYGNTVRSAPCGTTEA